MFFLAPQGGGYLAASPAVNSSAALCQFAGLAAIPAPEWGSGSRVRHILNRHRGRLMIESTPGAGANFSVRLPLVRTLNIARIMN